MSRRAVLAGVLGLGGLALYLWPALGVPVVLWSDSTLDMAWARQGVGIVSPAPLPDVPHPAKPAYLAFLRLAMAGAPAQAAPRQIIVVQSILLWLSIAAVCVFFARRTTFGRGVALYLILILFLRLRDSSSAVLSEALTAALFLPIAVILLFPFPRSASRELGLGFAAALLFLVRPNAGGAAAVLAVLAFGAARRWSSLAYFFVGFAMLLVPVWVITAPPGDPLRGLGANFRIARAEYGWLPAEGLEPPSAPEARRQLAWRALRGPLGLEFYDARWSAGYAAAGEWARTLSPICILAALALCVAPSRGSPRLPRILGTALFVFLVAQSFLLGALPRLALPMLPALFLFAIAAWPERPAAAMLTFAALLAGTYWQRHALDREWGRIESAGVRIVQTIPRGALPAHEPAWLFVRLAPPLPRSNAQVEILGPGGKTLYDSRSEEERRRPYVTMPLPASLLEANRRGPVSLTLVSGGTYDAYGYLMFPVLQRPWNAPARREGSAELSPSTGVASGGLDWWARAGAP